jgi:hypothetical protein
MEGISRWGHDAMTSRFVSQLSALIIARGSGRPILSSAVEINNATQFGCLIDKTIGDEVMFVVPCPTEGVMIPGIFSIGQFLGGLRILALAPENNWNFRIGISVGDLIYVKLGNDNYNEWTVFSEPVHVAKRLMSLEELADPNPIVCAFGINNSGANYDLLHFGRFNVNWRFDSPQSTTNLKGVGTVDFIVMTPLPLEAVEGIAQS